MMKARIGLLILFSSLILAGCLARKPVKIDSIVDFETAIQNLSKQLGDQLAQGAGGQGISLPFGSKKPAGEGLLKVAIDPFIDKENGYVLKINSRIEEVLRAGLGASVQILGPMTEENYQAADLILTGFVGLENKTDLGDRGYRFHAAIYDKRTGVVKAQASTWSGKIDTTPIKAYKESPTYMKGANYQRQSAAARVPVGGTEDSRYLSYLETKSIVLSGNQLFETGEVGQAMDVYKKAMARPDGEQLEILAMLFNSYIYQKDYAEAEAVFFKLLSTCVKETGRFDNKVTFAPKSPIPMQYEETAKLYSIYFRQIGKYMEMSSASCRLTIVGHCSKTGTEAFNDKLSLDRAKWVQRAISVTFPKVFGKSDTQGKGYHENIIGSGTDDFTDIIDRRVEFKFDSCSL